MTEYIVKARVKRYTVSLSYEAPSAVAALKEALRDIDTYWPLVPSNEVFVCVQVKP